VPPAKFSASNIPSFYAEGKNKLLRPRPLKSDLSCELSSFDEDTHRSSRNPSRNHKRRGSKYSHRLSYNSDIENRRSTRVLSSYKRENSNGGNISGAITGQFGSGRSGAQLSNMEILKINTPDITLDEALSHAALPCTTQLIEQNLEHMRYKTKVKVDARTGLSAHFAKQVGSTADLWIVSDDFYARQFLHAF